MARLNVCIQVNVDGGATKSGVMAEQALELAEAMVKLPNLQLRGIMSIPDDAPDFEAQCVVHKKAAAVFESIKASGLAGLEHFDTLSMGMTGDLEAAVAAGSTMVRVGSGIFGAGYTPEPLRASPSASRGGDDTSLRGGPCSVSLGARRFQAQLLCSFAQGRFIWHSVGRSSCWAE
jgi:D-serine deaminase-like pyridoxal phosphate-dependent protein